MIKVFVGTSSNGEDADAELALSYSLSTNTSRDVEIHWMRQTLNVHSPWYGWTTGGWSTPFSGFRWAIPEVMGWSGRALYMDVDQVNFRDISDLETMDLGGRPMAARRGTRFGGREFCVMVMDCEHPFWRSGPGSMVTLARQRNSPLFHVQRVAALSSLAGLANDPVADMDPMWNCHDGEGRPLEDIWHLHFTRMATQPWRPAWFKGFPEPHPRADLVAAWRKMVDSARADGWQAPEPERLKVPYDIIGR